MVLVPMAAVPLRALAQPQAPSQPFSPDLPVELEADTLKSVIDDETVAEGDARLRQGALTIRADRLRYRPATDRARAEGGVVIERPGSVFRGPELELSVRDFSGWFVAPEFDFIGLGTRGRADRVDFAGRSRLRAQQARYTSCARDAQRPDAEPAWELQARDVTLDFDANEGIADGARLRFQGVTILALPRLSFPVTDARKSGWLPPTIDLDSRSGLGLAVPYYWNLAPNRDATLAPWLVSRRGVGLQSEFRYLEPSFAGTATLDGLVHDRLASRSRWSLGWQHEQRWGRDLLAEVDAMRVSDDAWWKDFPRQADRAAPRLLHTNAGLERRWAPWGGEASAYARVADWQVLQDVAAPIVEPYARRPQLGLQWRAPAGPLRVDLATELNRFELPGDAATALQRPDGWRWHAAASAAWMLQSGALWMEPRVAWQARHYRTDAPMADGRTRASLALPTASIDAGLALERDTGLLFGRRYLQTLEPRLLYVYTPYRRQDTLPNFDAFGRDFNLSAIYAPNRFAGIDRVSDANQLTAGATTRLIDRDSGAEVLRLGAVQRFLFADQRVVPDADGSVDGPAETGRVSDLLLFGGTSLVPALSLDATLQLRADSGRLTRSVIGGTWTPAPFRTLTARYRLARGVSEQFEVGWQWPIYRAERPTGGSGCSGSWYSVGRLNYSLRDSRITDSIVGVEYDAGCWIARVVAERLSTGRTEATTRLLLQLELVGLSRLGTNPLRVLKDNIPGYRLLREERGADALPAGPPALPATTP